MSAMRVQHAGRLRRGVPAVLVLGLVSAALGTGAGGASAAPGRAGAGVPRAGSAPAGTISTVAGGVGGPARATTVAIGPCGLSSGHGHLYVGDYDSVRRVNPKTDWLTTPAGTGPDAGPLGIGGPAADSNLVAACATAVDHSGNLVIADGGLIAVVAASTGTFYGQHMTARHIYTVAGGGHGYKKTGVPAISVALTIPGGVAVDAHGNLVLAESSTQACSICTLYASVIQVVAVSSGRFYGQAMTAGDIYTIGGNRSLGSVGGDGGPARQAGLGYQLGAVALDQAGNVVFDQWDNSTVRVVAARTGTYYGRAMAAHHIYTIAGDGTTGYAGDGGPATSAELSGPFGVAFDRAGNLLIADTGNSRVRVVAGRTGRFYGRPMTAHHVYTIAGDGTAGFSGDGGPARRAELSEPDNVTLDGAGNMVISDTGNNRVRVVPASSGTFYRRPMTAGRIYTIAGNGSAGFSGMGGPATAAEIGPSGLAADGAGNVLASGDNRLLITAARSGTFYGQAMTAGHIYRVAGTGTAGYGGDGGPARRAELRVPSDASMGGVAVDAAGNLVVADGGNNRVRAVAARTGSYYGQAMTAGDIYTIAGDGTAGYGGDGGPATSAELNLPSDVTMDSAGNLLVSDLFNHRVRVVAARTGSYYGQAMTAGHIYTIAGDGTAGYAGDGGPATSAELDEPDGVTLDGAGNPVVADPFTNRVRVVAAHTGTYYGQAMTAGDIYTVAGDGGFGNSGDGGPATSASVSPNGIAVDPAGNLVISAYDRVRVVAVSTGTFYGVAMTAGDIYTVAGIGGVGYSGDGGPATSAEVDARAGILVTRTGNLLFATGDRVRMVTGGPTAATRG